MAIGTNIKRIRGELSIPAGALADKLDMSAKEYLELENGGGEFSEEELSDIAEVLGVSLEELLNGEELPLSAPEGEYLFKNSYVRTKEHIKGISAYCTFKRPLSKVMTGLFAVIFVVAAASLFIKFTAFAVVGLLYAPIHILMQVWTYKRFVKMLTARDLEACGGKEASFDITVSSKELVSYSSAGNITHIKLSEIKRIVNDENFFFVLTLQGKIYALEKHSFTEGNAEDFIEFAKNKGIRI